jgi:hypothetical protein
MVNLWVSILIIIAGNESRAWTNLSTLYYVVEESDKKTINYQVFELILMSAWSKKFWLVYKADFGKRNSPPHTRNLLRRYTRPELRKSQTKSDTTKVLNLKTWLQNLHKSAWTERASMIFCCWLQWWCGNTHTQKKNKQTCVIFMKLLRFTVYWNLTIYINSSFLHLWVIVILMYNEMQNLNVSIFGTQRYIATFLAPVQSACATIAFQIKI